MNRSRGIANRIRSRLRALGYWKAGRPDVSRFCRELGYLPQYIYAWLNGRVPSAENLIRLATALAVTPAWLLFGDGPPDGWMGAEIRQLMRRGDDFPSGASVIPSDGPRSARLRR